MTVFDFSNPVVNWIDGFAFSWYREKGDFITGAVLPDGLVPDILLEWNQMASSFRGLWFPVGSPIALDRLKVGEDGVLNFWKENHGCWEWGVIPDEEDPVVLESEPGSDFSSWTSTGNS